MPIKSSALDSRLPILSPVLASVVIGVLVLSGCGSANLDGAPNVKGLSLPSAEKQLQAHGYKASVTTEALFGVIVRSHYTVCSENTPDGKLVPIKVEKQC
jgi:hypothetical protein